MTSAGSSSSFPCPPPVTADPLATPTDSYGVVFSGRCLGRDKVVFLRSARIDGKYVKFSQKGSALVPSLETFVFPQKLSTPLSLRSRGGGENFYDLLRAVSCPDFKTCSCFSKNSQKKSILQKDSLYKRGKNGKSTRADFMSDERRV